MDPLLIWALILFCSGIGFLVAELFIPSAGLLSFLSAAALIGSIIAGFYAGPFIGMTFLIVVIGGIPVLIVVGLKIWPNTPIGRRVMLSTTEDAGGEEVEDEHQLFLRSLIGRVGKAKCEMLPGGLISVDGKTIDAVSQGMVIEKGTMVRVVSAQTNCVTVRPLEEGEHEDTGPADDVLQKPVDDILDSDPFDSDSGAGT